MSEPTFRFTTGGGSELLYYGDEFVAKFSSRHVKAFTAVLVANALMREEIDGFTKHIGAPSFEEAAAVLFRTKAQDEDKIEEMFQQVKDSSKIINELRPMLGGWREAISLTEDYCRDATVLKNMTAALNQIDDFKQKIRL